MIKRRIQWNPDNADGYDKHRFNSYLKIIFNLIKPASSAFYIIISVLSFAGCQKVINIDLNSASPAMIIVGNVNDQPGPYTVTLSQTVNFSQPNTFPAVSGAFIFIADNAGNIDTLVETSIPGTYHTKKIMGVAGRTYTLTVVTSGQTYSASSTMPLVVNFDTLTILQRIGIFRSNDTSLIPQVSLLDPVSVANYYRFIETRNDTLLSNVYVLDDQYFNGLPITYPLRQDTSLAKGDSVKIEMQCIDKGTYQFLSTFYIASGSSFITPANPTSAFTNNALGYFSAHTSRFRALKVQ